MMHVCACVEVRLLKCVCVCLCFLVWLRPKVRLCVRVSVWLRPRVCLCVCMCVYTHPQTKLCFKASTERAHKKKRKKKPHHPPLLALARSRCPLGTGPHVGVSQLYCSDVAHSDEDVFHLCSTLSQWRLFVTCVSAR